VSFKVMQRSQERPGASRLFVILVHHCTGGKEGVRVSGLTQNSKAFLFRIDRREMSADCKPGTGQAEADAYRNEQQQCLQAECGE